MNCQNLKNAIEAITPHNAPLRMDTDLHNLIPAFCHIGLVAVRPSKTGVRFFITVLNEENTAPIALLKVKVIHGLTEYTSIDVESGEVIETISETSDVQHHNGGRISCHVIATLCKTYNVAVRPSKTGIRLFSQLKNDPTANTLKERFLTDGTHDQFVYDDSGDEIDYTLIYAPYGADELH
jgi:hypothetical protein